MRLWPTFAVPVAIWLVFVSPILASALWLFIGLGAIRIFKTERQVRWGPLFASACAMLVVSAMLIPGQRGLFEIDGGTGVKADTTTVK